jgi:hypothetical protein
MITAAYWSQRSREAICAAIDAAKRGGITEGKDLEKYVRKNGYPFGVREHHPYKVWCREVKAMLNDRPHRQKGRAGYVEPTPLFKEEDPC